MALIVVLSGSLGDCRLSYEYPLQKQGSHSSRQLRLTFLDVGPYVTRTNSWFFIFILQTMATLGERSLRGGRRQRHG